MKLYLEVHLSIWFLLPTREKKVVNDGKKDMAHINFSFLIFTLHLMKKQW